MPIVIRGPQGGGHRLGAQHSQSLEAWFVNVPGLKVVTEPNLNPNPNPNPNPSPNLLVSRW